MILVTGGAGVMGSALVKRLVHKGHKVRVMTLPGDPGVSRVESYAHDIRFGDVSIKSDCARACAGVKAVYHLAAIIITSDKSRYRLINKDGTRNIAEASAAAGVKHLIHVSSASVIYREPTAYSLSKQEAEAIVAGAGVPWTIIRPTLVYDRGRGGQEFDLFLNYLRKFPVVPFIGNGNALKRPVFVEDIIDGLAKVYGKAATFGKVYNFSGGEAITMKGLARLCLRLMGSPGKPIVSLPVSACRAGAAVLERCMANPPLRQPVIAGVIQDANLDPAQAIAEIGYNPSNVTEKLSSCFPRLNLK